MSVVEWRKLCEEARRLVIPYEAQEIECEKIGDIIRNYEEFAKFLHRISYRVLNSAEYLVKMRDLDIRSALMVVHDVASTAGSQASITLWTKKANILSLALLVDTIKHAEEYVSAVEEMWKEFEELAREFMKTMKT